jgi:hypothetical protein
MSYMNGIKRAAKNTYPFSHRYSTISHTKIQTAQNAKSCRIWDSSNLPFGWRV